jgi:hypothetical protein
VLLYSDGLVVRTKYEAGVLESQTKFSASAALQFRKHCSNTIKRLASPARQAANEAHRSLQVEGKEADEDNTEEKEQGRAAGLRVCTIS